MASTIESRSVTASGSTVYESSKAVVNGSLQNLHIIRKVVD